MGQQSQTGATTTTKPHTGGNRGPGGEFPGVDFCFLLPAAVSPAQLPQKTPSRSHQERSSIWGALKAALRAVGERDSAKSLALAAPAFSSHQGTTSPAAKGYYQTNGERSEAQRRLLRSQVWDPCREEEAAAGTAKVRTLQTSFSKNSHEAPAREPGAGPAELAEE